MDMVPHQAQQATPFALQLSAGIGKEHPLPAVA
jgi:hypothetical protein